MLYRWAAAAAEDSRNIELFRLPGRYPPVGGGGGGFVSVRIGVWAVNLWPGGVVELVGGEDGSSWYRARG